MTDDSYKTGYVVTVGAALFLAATRAAGAASEYCGGLPAQGFEDLANQQRSGRYSNPTYGYSVQIPANVSGYAPAAGPERGFGIVLSWSPRAYLHVEAAYDMYYDITADHVHRSDLVGMKLDGKVIDDHAEHFSLANRAGGRYRTRVQCSSDPQIYVHEDVIVFVNREIYRLNLQTVENRYAADVAVLEALLRSWRWVKLQSTTQ